MTSSVVDSRSDLRGRMRARRSNERRASRRRLERSHPDQVVGRRREQKLPVDAGTSAMTELAQPTDRFHPAEDFFDAFPRHLADRVAGMASGPAIEGTTLRLQGDMGRGLE